MEIWDKVEAIHKLEHVMETNCNCHCAKVTLQQVIFQPRECVIHLHVVLNNKCISSLYLIEFHVVFSSHICEYTFD